MTGYLGTWDYRVTLQATPDGPPVMPAAVSFGTPVAWSSLRGHASYYLDPNPQYSNQACLEIRAVDDSGGLFWVMELERLDQ